MYFRDTGNFKVTGALWSQAARIRVVLMYLSLTVCIADMMIISLLKVYPSSDEEIRYSKVE